MTLESVSRFLQRSQELGPWGTLQAVWVRTTNGLVLRSRSLWWGWRARRTMSDAALLARTTGDWRSVAALLNHMASRPASSFILPHDPTQAASLLGQHYPEHQSAILAAADAACRCEFVLHGRTFRCSPGIDWHRDPVTGWRWPLWHRSRVGQYLSSPTRPADLRFFWELNRHQHFIKLGIAYWLTGDQRYVDAFCSQLQSWIDTNPPQHGANWCNGIEVAVRLLAWTVAFQFFRGSKEFRDRAGSAFLKSLWQQTDFLSSHLQTTVTDVPNNHMIAELVGLLLVGAAFPEFRAAAAWRETGLRLLKQQVGAQTHPDGVNKEQATGYHRFVAEFLLLVIVRSRQGALPHEPILEKTLEGMLDYVRFILTPAGTPPMWGDADYASVLGLGLNKNFWDFRPILAAGAVLFDRPDWKFLAGRFDEEAFWLLSAHGLKRWEQLNAQPPKQTSRSFPDAGLYVIRDTWAADTDVAFFRCGPFGLGSEGHCAHAHCDLLSFMLWVSGQPLLVDSGSYMYHGPWRDHFRLTAAHNTVMIDGRDQAIPVSIFGWKHVPEAKCVDWNEDRVSGVLTSGQVTFIRELAHPHPGIWELVDNFAGRDEHTMEWFFHFAPGLELELDDEGRVLTVFKNGQSFLIVHIPDGGVRPQVRESWYSRHYGAKQSNRELFAHWQGKLDDNAVSFHWRFQLVNERPLPGGDTVPKSFKAHPSPTNGGSQRGERAEPHPRTE